MYDALPYELKVLIFEHVAAMKIQSCVRKFFYRHVHHSSWCTLRALMSIQPDVFDTLQRNPLVRCEWRREIGSWISVIRDLGIPYEIFKEVCEGLWNPSLMFAGALYPIYFR